MLSEPERRVLAEIERDLTSADLRRRSRRATRRRWACLVGALSALVGASWATAAGLIVPSGGVVLVALLGLVTGAESVALIRHHAPAGRRRLRRYRRSQG